MDEKTAGKLLALNREFYQTFASYFSATRKRLQPGVKKILDNTPLDANILELGCGNGELASSLAKRGHRGWYFGLDFSPALLEIAHDGLTDFQNFLFVQGDLASPDWDSRVKQFAGEHIPNAQFDLVFAFAAFHHLPGSHIQIQSFRKTHNLLKTSGHLIHSNWQFLKSNRLKKRIQPWSAINLTPEDIDPGDYLLDWRQGGYGIRYVHHFNQDELISLAQKSGYKVVESFYSDGEGGNLGLYQIWEKDLN
jgi:SAM-dependent methyltransferase